MLAIKQEEALYAQCFYEKHFLETLFLYCILKVILSSFITLVTNSMLDKFY